MIFAAAGEGMASALAGAAGAAGAVGALTGLGVGAAAGADFASAIGAGAAASPSGAFAEVSRVQISSPTFTTSPSATVMRKMPEASAGMAKVALSESTSTRSSSL